MPRNVEIKVRLADAAAAAEVARRAETLGGELREERQVDTYFPAARGRLKLRRRFVPDAAGGPDREIEAQLVAYERPDAPGERGSDWTLATLAAGTRLDLVLALAVGPGIVVDKRRRIRIVDRVRIHLDEVAGLGEFLELEALVDPALAPGEKADAEATARLRRILAALGAERAPVIAGSYRDLVAARTPGSSGKSASAS